MAYTKKLWIARVGTALNRFLKTNEDAGSVELTNDPTGITTAGTPFTVANMNNIETGIEDNDVRLDVVEGTGTPQGVGTEDDVSFGTVNTGQGANELYDMDQNVKTTDSPTFLGTIVNGVLITARYKITSFSSPDSQPFGLAFDGTNLISCDFNQAKIYIHTGVSGDVSSFITSPSTNPSGLTIVGGNLISCNFTIPIIYIHDEITSNIVTQFNAPAGDPSGLTYDGTNLISCDAATGLIYIHYEVTGGVTDSFASPGGTPTGLAFNGINLISCDNSTDKIYIHDGITSTILNIIDSQSTDIGGLTFADTDLISCDKFADLIYKHKKELI